MIEISLTAEIKSFKIIINQQQLSTLHGVPITIKKMSSYITSYINDDIFSPVIRLSVLLFNK